MSLVYLNGEYVPLEQARISPMDRGFLFGEGIYEVIPAYDGKLIGFKAHMARMAKGLDALQIVSPLDDMQWLEMVEQLIQRNGGGDRAVYLHVTRGADSKRFHGYNSNLTPTVFALSFAIPPEQVADRSTARSLSVTSRPDLRWKRCHIKTTALLGNVMHFQEGVDDGSDETILFNEHDQLTEASSSNVFVVKDKQIFTPALDSQKLPGITRNLLIDILQRDGTLKVKECDISKADVLQADEIWLTSSTKCIAPVTRLDGQPVGDGTVGEIWQFAQSLFSKMKYDY